MMFKRILLIGITLIIGGCGIILPFYGIKKPSDDPPAFQKRYLAGLGLDTTNVYRIKEHYKDSLSAPKYLLNTYKQKTGASASAVQIRMYNNQGVFIYGWEQCFGNLKHFDIFTTVPISSKYTHLPINMQLSLQTDLNLYEITPTERDNLLKEIERYDYVIAVYWASWAGYFSKNTLSEVDRYVKDSKEKKIIFIKFNTANYPADPVVPGIGR